MSDLRIALRALMTARGVTTTAVMTLGAGMMLCIVMAVMNAYLVRTLLYPAADRLYRVDVETHAPVTPGTRFRMGTASTQAYVPQFPKKPWHVTLRQLMGNVSGVTRGVWTNGGWLRRRIAGRQGHLRRRIAAQDYVRGDDPRTGDRRGRDVEHLFSGHVRNGREVGDAFAK